jgi:hypothetical protein
LGVKSKVRKAGNNMENWLFLFLGLLLGIPFSIFANISTPWIKSYIENRSLTTKQRRIKILIEHYKWLKKLKETPALLNIVAFKQIAYTLMFITMTILAIGFIILTNFLDIKTGYETGSTYLHWLGYLALVGLSAFAALYYISNMISDINNILSFDWFRKMTIARLKKLGGNPEELDKEEGG